MAFELKKEQVGGVLVLRVEGEFVLGPQLRHSSSNVKNLEGVTGIVVDLTECRRVDSAGMGELLMWYSIAAQAQQRLLLAGASEAVRVMMRTARVDSILLHAVDKAAAMDELSRG